ncbi:protein hapless 2 [Holotrichia oblita]|uniref:Protein hapless 2 n=1 Tax=Holotrichia oblita TaxID=644536 RepID=A0ACB9SWG6_HOLOL|nr:protein hapless 2 [Holotrichia oblita]
MRCCKRYAPPSNVEIRAVIVRCINPPNVCTTNRNIKKPLNRNSIFSLENFHGFDEDEPLVQSEVTRCSKKLILTIKIKNFGHTNTHNQFIVVDHVYDPISDQTVRLLNPYVIKMKQEQVSQSYSMKFEDFVNSNAREHVYNKHDGNYTGCFHSGKKPTCGLILYKGEPLKYSTGFCCSCDAEKNAQRQPLSGIDRSAIASSDPAYLMDAVMCPRTKLDDARAEIKKLKEKEKELTMKLNKLKKKKPKIKTGGIQKENQKRNMDNRNLNQDSNLYYINPQSKYEFARNKIYDDPSERKETKLENDIEFSTAINLNDDLSTEMNMMIDSMNREHNAKKDGAISTKRNNKPSMHAVLTSNSHCEHNLKDNIKSIADKAFQDAFKSLNRNDGKMTYLEREDGPSPADLESDLSSNLNKKRQVQSSGIQRRGGQNCADRFTPPHVDPETYHESTHCLRFSPVWYGVYKLAKPVVEQEVILQVFEKFETPTGAFKWKDITRGEKIKMGTFYSFYKDKVPTISMTFNSLFDDVDFCLDYNKMKLLIPEGLKEDDLIKYPEARGGPPEFLLVPAEKVHLGGDRCDVAGVGFEAFYKQPNRCSMPRGSCLHHQPYHMWYKDKDMEKNDKQGCHFLKYYGTLSKNPIKRNKTTGSKFLSLNYYGRYISIIDMEINADTNAVLRPTSSAVITEVYIDGTCATRTSIIIKVSNAGLLSSRFMVRVADCPLEIEEHLKNIQSDLIMIPPQNQHIFHLVVHIDLHIDVFHCSVEVVNPAGELVALRRIKIQKLDRCICTWHCLCACIGSASGLKCIPMKLDHYHAAGFKGGLPIITRINHITLSNDVLHLLMFIGIFVVLLLFSLGLTKALIGLCCNRTGMWGLDVLLDLPRNINRYYDRDLQDRPVQYNQEGWPIHPDTGEKIRNIPATTEFCINITFFFTYPTIMFLLLLRRICWPFHRYPKGQGMVCTVKGCIHKRNFGGTSNKRTDAPLKNTSNSKSEEDTTKRKSKVSIKAEPIKIFTRVIKVTPESSDNPYYYTSTDENTSHSNKSKGSKR